MKRVTFHTKMPELVYAISGHLRSSLFTFFEVIKQCWLLPKNWATFYQAPKNWATFHQALQFERISSDAWEGSQNKIHIFDICQNWKNNYSNISFFNFLYLKGCLLKLVYIINKRDSLLIIPWKREIYNSLFTQLIAQTRTKISHLFSVVNQLPMS